MIDSLLTATARSPYNSAGSRWSQVSEHALKLVLRQLKRPVQQRLANHGGDVGVVPPLVLPVGKRKFARVAGRCVEASVWSARTCYTLSPFHTHIHPHRPPQGGAPDDLVHQRAHPAPLVADHALPAADLAGVVVAASAWQVGGG